ncbi:signal peptidase II [Spirochaetota bacterium]
MKIKNIPFLKQKIIILILVIPIILSFDLITKSWAEHQLRYNSPMVVIPNFWSFYYQQNKDIGFSVFHWLDEKMSQDSKKIMIIIMQLIATCFALYLYTTLDKKIYLIPWAMIISGALGNVINRIAYGYVVDFVMWYIPSSPFRIFNPWPIFNVADSSIVCGGITLIVMYLFFDKRKTKKV